MSYPIRDVQTEIARKTEFIDLRNTEGLYPHQEFVRRFMSPYTPYKGLLLFHTLGSGKSLICISVAVDHYLHDGKHCLIITKGNSGMESFKKQIDLYYDMSDIGIPRAEYNKIFITNHYMTLHNSVRKLSDEAIATRFNNHVLVFDEIHNIRKLGNCYDSLRRIIQLPENTKTLLVTATPMTNDVEQLDSTIELLTDVHISFNSEIKRRPREIYHGKKGYLSDMKVYPSEMISHQLECHTREEGKGVPKDIYRTLTHVSLFCFPGDEELYGRNIFTRGILYPVKHSRMITSMKTGAQKLIKYTFYHIRDEYRKWLTGDNLRMCSSKYWTLMNVIRKRNNGPIFIFVEEVRGSGLLLLANILEAHGYELYTGDHLDTIRPKKRYTFCVGDQSLVPNKSDRLEGFNHPLNIRGDYVNILIGSKIIGESITLLNVRMFHVMTIHWNDSTVEQAIGRVIRSGSHDMLPEDERTVDIYIHATGTDFYKLEICNKKQESISKMETMLSEKAVDRYIGTEVVEDPSTFILYYMDRFWDILHGELLKIKYPVSVDTVVENMVGIHPSIAMETIYKTVVTNTQVRKKYLRESNGMLHLVSDPSTPFFSIYKEVPITDVSVSLKPIIPGFNRSLFRRFRGYDLQQKVEFLRQMQFLDRISFVENIVKDRLDDDVETMFGALFMTHHGIKYHIMCYRIPGDAYTAVLPIPKPNTLQNKTRILDNGRWRYMDPMDVTPERNIIARMEKKHDRSMKRVDDKEEMYMIISLIDNKSRLRTRVFEKTTKGNEDKRFIRKGRCLSSILKTDLGLLYAYILQDTTTEVCDVTDTRNYDERIAVYGYRSSAYMKRKYPVMYSLFMDAMVRLKTRDIVKRVEDTMISNGKYLFL
jgi:hypothetical protein